MHQEQTKVGSQIKKTQLPIIDDFEIDGLDFKPVTDGLGFHGEREKKKSPFLEGNSIQKKNKEFVPLASSATLAHTPSSHNIDQQSSLLESFYNQNVHKELREKNSNKVKEKIQVKAPLTLQLLSFGSDILLLVTCVLLTMALFYFVAHNRLDFYGVKSFLLNNIDLVSLFSLMIYLIYFSLFDGIGTLGKRLFSLKLVSKRKNKVLTITQSFNRAFLCLVGLCLVGIPCILGLHDSMSETEVIKK